MDEILNTSNINNVRFRMAKPQGYYTEDVERFIDVEVKESLAAYQQEVETGARKIESLESRINQLNNTIAEFEIKDNFSAASNNIEQDEALMASLEKQEAMEVEMTNLKTKVASLEADLKAKDEYIAELNKYIDDVQPIVEEGSKAIEELAALKAGGVAIQPEVQPEPIVEEDLTSYDSEDETITKRNKVEKKKPKKQEEDFSDVQVTETIVDANAIDFDNEPEVDMDMLNEELMNASGGEGYDPNEFETLPDGTVVPKGIRPEDL
jgi:hypothetical protein